MALVQSDLHTVSIADGRNVHYYTTNDTAVQAGGADYFLDVQHKMNVGDFIFAYVDMDGTPAVSVLVVASSTTATVTTTALA